MKYIEKDGVTYGVTSDRYLVLLLVKPHGNLKGQYAENGISVPSTGRWIVYPGRIITARDVKEIEKKKTVIPTLFWGTRKDIVQAR